MGLVPGDVRGAAQGGRSGCPTVTFSWLKSRFGELPDDASDELVVRHGKAYIWMLLSTSLFGDKTAARAHVYRSLCRAANRNVVHVAGPLDLLQSWIFWRFPILRPYSFDTFEWPLASR
ncbi:hypothetical protein PIB30_019964 [Stylosanthes scabra]|uniref:Aminotransferase-like plant mobile domain-containing protein n=1 Tax=Stylosanthes scabra TaxID=79078 RepID=A0ABU6X6P1_9FABA|nr:hypothetical protein [Stylosanthes scabra]